MNGNSIKISFCGDLMCLKEQLTAISKSSDKISAFNSIFEHVRPLLNSSDYVIGNLETPISDTELSSTAINFNTPPEFLYALKNAGFNFVSTANNHCLDRGIEGIHQTLENLDNCNIQHSGTYSSPYDSKRIFTVNIQGIKIAIISATFGTNSELNGNILSEEELWRVDLLKKQNKPARIKFNPSGKEGQKIIYDNVSTAAINNIHNKFYLQRILDKIEAAKQLANIIIVLPHIGGQYNSVPGTYTRYIISEISKLKPSLIVAGHPHVPLRFEIINQIGTAYSLGNFTFTPNVGYFIPNVFAEYGIILHSYWNKDNYKLERMTFSIIKNIVCNDGISRVMPVSLLYERLQSPIDKERLMYEAESVGIRFATTTDGNWLDSEVPLLI